MLSQFAERYKPVGIDVFAILRSPLMWCLLVAGLVAARHLYTNGAGFFDGVGGTDDATRLVHLRDFWASGAWFDLSLVQIGAPDALNSHWSRLIDLPLALAVSLFGLILGEETAVTVVRILWPSILLLALLYLVARDVERRAGAAAVVIFLFMVFGSLTATFQFHPGRVDHHNVQILCAIGGVVLLQRSLSDAWFGFPAGALFGFGFVIGLEALLPVVAILAIGLGMSGFFPDMRQGVRRALRTCAGVMLIGFVLTTAPAQWGNVVCDALSLNLLMLFGVGTATMTFLKVRLPHASALQWMTGLAIGGGVGLAAYIAADPVCMGGPLARIDPLARTVWLDKVIEVMTVVRYAEITPTGAISFLAVVAAGVGVLGSELYRTRNAEALFSFLSVLVMAIYGCLYMRLMPYAIWLAIPAIAVWVAQLPAIGNLSRATVRAGLALVLSQGTLVALLSPVIAVFSSADAVALKEMTPLTKACSRTETINSLRSMPPGLIANDIDLGPYIALHTSHRVVAAPYHRIDKSIIAVHRIFSSAPKESERLLRQLQANYVVACRRRGGKLAELKADSLMYALQNGESVSFLEPMAVGHPGSPLLVWQVKPAGE